MLDGIGIIIAITPQRQFFCIPWWIPNSPRAGEGISSWNYVFISPIQMAQMDSNDPFDTKSHSVNL